MRGEVEELAPNRWLHIRLSRPFTDEEFACFAAQTKIWVEYVKATLSVWESLNHGYAPPRYIFFEPELSEDRRVCSLPVGGEVALGPRSMFENSASSLLWQHFPIATLIDLEEGLTEDLGSGPVTNWRPAVKSHQEDPLMKRLLGRLRR